MPPALPRDENRVPVSGAINTVDGISPLPLELNPTSGGLLVDLVSSIPAGTNNIGTVFTKYADSGTIDAFGRLRVSDPVTIFDAYQQYDLNSLLWEDITSGGSVTHLPLESSVQLSTGGTTSGNYAYRQTRAYHRYQAGKSQLILFTANLGAKKANVRQRAGYFDAQNGVFFEQDGSNLKIVRRSNVTGTPVDTAVNQADWNKDTMDGNGDSGINIDTSKVNIFFIDLEWLGAGRVRFGFFNGQGIPVVAHELRNANSLTSVYMTTANLPVRFEIQNTGTAASTTTMKHVCTSVISEGGFERERGLPQTANNGITGISVSTRRAVLSIRPKATFNSIVNRAEIDTLDFDILGTTGGTTNIFYEIVYNPTFTTAGGALTWTSAGANSAIEYSVHGDANAGAFTAGMPITSGYIQVASKAVGQLSKEILSKLPLVLDNAGSNPIAISVVLTSFTGSVTATAALNWKELK